MTDKPYHHGNLRTELIEAGIDILNTEGLKGFSLRKVAAKCSVSHTAPYSHFKDIDALIMAMSEHVTNQFVESLSLFETGKENEEDTVLFIGKAYINFFKEHPPYFQFLFYHSGININLDKENSQDYLPFAIFQKTAFDMFEKKGYKRESFPERLASLWSVVHGIVALLTNPNIKYSGDWQKVFQNIIK